MNTSFPLPIATSLLVMVASMQADTLELKNGQVIEGVFQGGTAQTVRFQTKNETKVFQRNDIVAVTFTGPAVANAGGSAPSTGEAAPGTSGSGASSVGKAVTVPAGTRIQVRMDDGVDTSKDSTGKKFTGKLESALSANGVAVAPPGSVVHGQVARAEQAGRVAGQSTLSLVLTDILVNSQAIPLTTQPVTVSGQAEGRQTARRGAAGALIGGIADGGEGAAKGAAVGAGTAAVRKGQAVVVPPGSLLEFNLSQPLTLQTGS